MPPEAGTEGRVGALAIVEDGLRPIAQSGWPFRSGVGELPEIDRGTGGVGTPPVEAGSGFRFPRSRIPGGRRAGE